MRLRTLTLCAVQFVDVMGVTVVVAALPRMLASVHGSATDAGLLVPAYAVGFGGLLLLAARLGDRLGPRRIVLAGLALYAIGSVLCASAQAPAALLVGRFLQGVGAAASVPNALVLLIASAPRRERALSAWNATGGLAGAAGLLVGGLVTSSLGWRVIFWAGLAAVVVLALAIIRVTPADGEPTTERDHLNLPSVGLQTVTVAALVAAANATTHSWRITAALLAVVAILVPPLLIRERRTTSQLVPTRTRRRPGVLAGVAGSFGVTATTSPLVILTTLYFQDSEGFSPAGAGLMILPFSFAVVVGAAVATRLLRVATPLTILLSGLGMIGLAGLLAARQPSLVVVSLVMAGAGNGVGAVAAYALGTAVPPEEQGTVTGLLNTAAQLGTAIMVATAIGVATATGNPLNHRAGWLTVAATAALTCIACLWLHRRTLEGRRGRQVSGSTRTAAVMRAQEGGTP
ncbi:MFS transporter [Kribbella sp. NPDC026611]|uniref:MFS transporter n=1 Tax=Kribbella sp. NPDC026611 TaxID=3154911 RepID=UPI0033DB6010